MTAEIRRDPNCPTNFRRAERDKIAPAITDMPGVGKIELREADRCSLGRGAPTGAEEFPVIMLTDADLALTLVFHMDIDFARRIAAGILRQIDAIEGKQ